MPDAAYQSNQPTAPPQSGKTSQGPQHVEIACTTHGHFVPWLSAAKSTLVLSAYQANKLVILSAPNNQAQLLMREMEKPMGIASNGYQLIVSTRHGINSYANAPKLAPTYKTDSGKTGVYDALYLPRVTYHLNDNFIHDLAFGDRGIVMVNTMFNCLATVSPDWNFQPLWKPEWITQFIPEDRCHLNGMALVDGKVKYITALGTGDSKRCWNESKAVSGVIAEVPSSKVLLDGLCMPHSPRWNGTHLYFLNSGKGELCRWLPGSKEYEVLAGFNGFLRGLHLMGSYAVIGMSKIREKKTFDGLPIRKRANEGEDLMCGMVVVELETGREVGRFEFTAGCTETYDILSLPGTTRANILTYQKDAAFRAYSMEQRSFWTEPEEKNSQSAAIVC